MILTSQVSECAIIESASRPVPMPPRRGIGEDDNRPEHQDWEKRKPHRQGKRMESVEKAHLPTGPVGNANNVKSDTSSRRTSSASRRSAIC
jgi:hypothetical protein